MGFTRFGGKPLEGLEEKGDRTGSLRHAMNVSTSSSDEKRARRRASTSSGRKMGLKGLMVLSLAGAGIAAAQGSESCVSLKDSTACPAFKDYSISTNLKEGEFSFLAFVGNVNQFDQQLDIYASQAYAQKQYQDRFGCQNVDLTNPSSIYARFTKSVLCSRLVRASKACNDPVNEPPVLCASSCADWATSEQIIAADNKTCGTTLTSAMDAIKSDFVICSVDPGSPALSDKCVQAASNEPKYCGFGDSPSSFNLQGLCYYCSKQKEKPTSADACCYNADSETLCQGVELPDIPSLPPLPTGTGTDPKDDKKNSSKISGGAIAGIVIGSIIALTLIALLIFFCMRRRRQNVFLNQPTSRHGGSSRGRNNSMSFQPAPAQAGYETLPGRIARMSALEQNLSSSDAPSPPPVGSRSRRRHLERSSSSDFGLSESPASKHRQRTPDHRGPMPRDRQASLSSASILMDANPSSPLSDSEKGASSPQFASPQSEQLQAFKDYYSKDEIRPGDKVAVLWAYSPRAPDEFELDRGDVLKVVGIWDDGWATGMRLNDRAEDLSRRRTQRDSGVSASQNSQRQGRDRRASSPTPVDGQVKAFPLVCVCLPDHWQKTIENDGANQSTPSSPGRPDPAYSPSSAEKKMPHKGSSRFNEDLNPPIA